MDQSIGDDFWYRDLPFTGKEITGYRSFLSQLSELRLPKENLMNLKSSWLDLQNNSILDYWDKYNIFTYEDDQMYDLLQHIKALMLRACSALTIDYDKQKYHIHGWVDIYDGEFNNTDIDNINWYDQTLEENVFSGMFFFDAEDSTNYYVKDNHVSEIENIGGRLVLFTNHKWFHGKWKEEREKWAGDRPKIVFGFNIYPIKNLPALQNTVANYIPL